MVGAHLGEGGQSVARGTRPAAVTAAGRLKDSPDACCCCCQGSGEHSSGPLTAHCIIQLACSNVCQSCSTSGCAGVCSAAQPPHSSGAQATHHPHTKNNPRRQPALPASTKAPTTHSVSEQSPSPSCPQPNGHPDLNNHPHHHPALSPHHATLNSKN